LKCATDAAAADQQQIAGNASAMCGSKKDEKALVHDGVTSVWVWYRLKQCWKFEPPAEITVRQQMSTFFPLAV